MNVTSHPSANWTLQQLREVVGDCDNHKYLIHERSLGTQPYQLDNDDKEAQ